MMAKFGIFWGEKSPYLDIRDMEGQAREMNIFLGVTLNITALEV